MQLTRGTKPYHPALVRHVGAVVGSLSRVVRPPDSRKFVLLVIVAMPLLGAAGTLGDAETFVVPFWANAGAEDLPGRVWLHEDGPC